ncbi:MAG: CvpA family protein [Bacteroidota bacterium]|nr:CvpA family protein [Bacteroidota bacterium]
MNIIDILLILIVVFAVWAGWRKGFIYSITDLIIWLGSLRMGFFLYQNVGELLRKIIPSLGVWVLPLGFLFTIIFSRILFSFILYRIVRTAPKEAHHSIANRAFGMLPGLITGAVYAAIVAALLLSIPAWNGLTKEAGESKIANQLGVQVAWLDEKFSPIFGAAAKDAMNRIMVKPESEETVDLHYTVKNPEVRPDLEAQMLVLVNNERTKRGLPAVKADPDLAVLARAHSTDMFARGYFSHYTLEKADPFDRMKKAGIKFFTAGENLALGRTLKICHEGLMNSPGHKANILNPAFGRLGIGIMDGGIYGLMISQEFRN